MLIARFTLIVHPHIRAPYHGALELVEQLRGAFEHGLRQAP